MTRRIKPVPPVPTDGIHGRKRRFTDEEVWEIRKQFNNGLSKSSLSEEFGVSVKTLSDAIHGKNAYKNV